MSEHYSEDCGSTRRYIFRRIQTNTIRFRVRAERDAAICLTTDDAETPEDMYEIFIGCWGGGESGIRRLKHDDVCRIETPDILCEDDFRGFWIQIRKGVIKVGREGQKNPFMTYSDPETLLHVSWYGFSTGWGADGHWTFEDERDSCSSSSSVSSSDSEAECIHALEEKPIQYKRPARWVPCSSGYFPKNPVSAGVGHEGEVFVGMAPHEGGHILGKIIPEHGVCYVPYGGEEVPKELYYGLSNPGGVELSWLAGSAGKVPTGALQGGFSEDGEALYIGRVCVDGAVSCGKVHPSHGVCYVPYGGSEHSHRDYEVLVISGIPCRM
ncbi:uncharacterized protein LOC143023402 [Oratosquilla oratoria]|uniref:uncharacterized protein LOC143023402 n=1 Tax=Oratosquilla oratoria TaxID=337810 RepID=UPI003F758A0C